MRFVTCAVLLTLTGSLLMALTPVQSITSTESSIRGILTRGGTSDPLPDVQISLEGAINPETMQALLRDAASAGITVNPPAGASLSETTQLMISTAASRGLPIQAQGIQNIVTRAVGEQKWPTVISDRDGSFNFPGVKPGRYTVRAVREGFFGKPVNGSYPPTSWVDIVVGEKEIKQAALSMVPGAIIGGRVYDTSGATLSNVNVQVYSVAYQTGFALLQPAIAGAAKTTDDQGQFRLFWIPPGDYYLGAAPPARPGGPGAAFQPGARTFYPNVTRLNDAIPITIRGGEDLRLDISIRNAPLFKIAGTVANPLPLAQNPNGDGLLPATVFFHLANRDLETPNDATTANNSGNIALAVSSGPFELSNIAPGSYEVLARVADPQSGAGLGAFAWGRAIVDIDTHDVRDVSIAVNHPVTVKGIVRMSSAAAMPANLRIPLTPMGGSSRVALYTLVSTRPSPVATDGSFAVASVPPGRFRIAAVSGLPPDYYIADVLQNSMSVFDTGFDIDNHPPNPIEILLSNGAGQVDGTVLDSNRKPFAGAVVALVPEAKRFENRALLANGTSDAAGHFSFRGVAPGDYRLLSWESTPPNAYQNAGFIQKYDSKAQIVHVVQRATVQMDLTVIPAIEQR